ncbi:MAG: hypothetical protein HY744_13725 [Deltaproteobacteria bacterium]|nr:hypothetical protein [Deltaproteobacteria bacterium]
MSYRSAGAEKKAVTVRVPAARLRGLMRARGIATQSELVNTVLAEEEERLRCRRVLRETAGVAATGGLDDCLL